MCGTCWKHFSPHFDDDGKVKKHLRAFYPYIERLHHPDAEDVRPSTQRHPINVAVIKNWLGICAEHHGYHCRPGTHNIPSCRPKRLIDVEKWCIVPAEDHVYLTLSYVWGISHGDSPVCLTDETRSDLEREGGLRGRSLPKTIEQAMELVRRLGRKYLWVDRLCINQSWSREKNDELASMAEIYAGSFLTIVAAQGGDAMDPLWSLSLSDDPGQIGRQGERTTRQEIMHGLAQSLVKSTWWSRGWTCQEYYFSRRKLIFNDNTIAWECHCASWHEAQRVMETGSCGKHPRDDGGAMAFDLDPWPNFHRFTRMLCLFNARHLTYPGDALDALDGALSTLSTAFHGGFISGLPQMMFDAALLWQPYYPMTRREARSAILPSWSPLGHHGSIYSEDWEATCNFIRDRDPNLRRPCSYTLSTVEWSYWDVVSKFWFPISVSAEQWRLRYSGAADLPKGWSYHQHTSSYKHISDPTQEFWHTVPICDPGYRLRPVLTPYIQGETCSATLTAVPMSNTRTERCADALLLTDAGKHVGYIRLNDRGESQRVCLIELSRGSTTWRDGFTERYVEFDYPDLGISRDEVYEFVNIMWIAMRQGIAERKAVGRVKKVAWQEVAGEKWMVTIG